jgi:hypothetical protein
MVSQKHFIAAMIIFFLVGKTMARNNDGVTGDSTKNKFALDDPRNPECPCHNYQALA